MKSKSTELDVDFIGGQGPLTKSEEKVISKFIRSCKAKHTKKQRQAKQTKQRKRTTTARKKVVK